jgi:hypothetical protein
VTCGPPLPRGVGQCGQRGVTCHEGRRGVRTRSRRESIFFRVTYRSRVSFRVTNQTTQTTKMTKVTQMSSAPFVRLRYSHVCASDTVTCARRVRVQCVRRCARAMCAALCACNVCGAVRVQCVRRCARAMCAALCASFFRAPTPQCMRTTTHVVLVERVRRFFTHLLHRGTCWHITAHAICQPPARAAAPRVTALPWFRAARVCDAQHSTCEYMRRQYMRRHASRPCPAWCQGPALRASGVIKGCGCRRLRCESCCCETVKDPSKT